jgi:hypothetical protein
MDAALIGEFRRRVIYHNEAGGERVKLGELKKIYVENFSGANPAMQAMDSVDRHLAELNKVTGSVERLDKPEHTHELVNITSHNNASNS